jgi:hypothetical protein
MWLRRLSTSQAYWSLILVRHTDTSVTLKYIDPAPGMTSANLKLATVAVLLDDKLETPDQQLDQGEHIVKRVVALKDLDAELKGEFCFACANHVWH